MSISPPHIPPVNGIGSEYQNLTLRPRTELTSFRKLLNETVQQGAGGFANDAQPLSKDQLIALIQEIQAQMDAHWMSTLSSDEKETGGLPRPLPLGGRFLLPGIEASKNRHTTPNHGGFNGEAPLAAAIANAESPLGLDGAKTRRPAPNLEGSSGRPPLDAVIAAAARTHSVDEALVKSVIKAESDFNPNSTSPKGAMGLMQLMPETARELGVQNGYDPVENVGAGTRYLKMLLNRYDGNVPVALAAYNWGMGNIEKRPGQMPAETRRYVDRVTRHYAALKA